MSQLREEYYTLYYYYTFTALRQLLLHINNTKYKLIDY